MEFKSSVAELLVAAVSKCGGDLEVEAVKASLSRPPKPDMGDAAFGCFPLAKQLRKSPAVIASELQDIITAHLG